MIQYHQEENNYPKAIAISTGIMGVFLAISFFIIASRVEPEDIGTGGIIVNYGTTEFGMGDDYMSIEEPSSSVEANNASPDQVVQEDVPVTEASAEQSDKSIVTQNTEDAPEIVTKANSPSSTPTVNTAKDEKPKVNQNALYKGKASTSTGKGDGTSDQAGNQGSALGDPLSPDYGAGGSGFGDVALDLKSRRFTNLVIPKDEGQKYGKVAVRIYVNKSGVVVNAVPGVKGTTLSDAAIWEKCKRAVMGASLNKLESAPETQIGVVVFNFKVR